IDPALLDWFPPAERNELRKVCGPFAGSPADPQLIGSAQPTMTIGELFRRTQRDDDEWIHPGTIDDAQIEPPRSIARWALKTEFRLFGAAKEVATRATRSTVEGPDHANISLVHPGWSAVRLTFLQQPRNRPEFIDLRIIGQRSIGNRLPFRGVAC